MREAESTARVSERMDLWSLYDAPHMEDVTNPLVFAEFLRSGSTRTVVYSSMFNTVAILAVGPEGGKVTFHAVKSHLEPEDHERLMAAVEEARVAGKVVSPEVNQGRIESEV